MLRIPAGGLGSAFHPHAFSLPRWERELPLRVPPGCAEGPEGRDTLRLYPFPGGLTLVSPKRCRRSLLPGVWGCPPIMCHCEPFSERSEPKARQSPLPEMATSPLAAGAPRHDRIGKSGTQGVQEELCIVSIMATEVQDASCRGFGGVPQFPLSPPKSGGQGVERRITPQPRQCPPALATTHREALTFYCVPTSERGMPDTRGKQPC
jgi:hypothetical protein